jgi:hypothetical protein
MFCFCVCAAHRNNHPPADVPVGSTRSDLKKPSLNLYVEIKLDGSGQTNEVKQEEPTWDQEFRVYV